MKLLFFLLRLIALPFILAFFLIGGAVYLIFLGCTWVILGDAIRIWLTFPDWK